ncbi:MAG: NADH:ubiquinone reductase (Na(+)-transporting) subunit B [Sphingobacteriales bacterium 17-39-43]|uniref:NADH:ubiquinone reductase (Na(+)-transporting) subunit B n=1 Tax=Daejeonella sp. TaxID=2805397 RepID=UPI000BD2E921|nr:NADH:ubiquinone reductase (Na(+)-transporting) subunit B [Daejeonella sp.]OYZ28877.1 MAG: NADH:ubiquinone reductase (Na(+)-transporting) subunit B [Sphingobacteriales bacterium 16-39-50]OZA22263.1 MAG: NADH:ubiquinone reductase (Na(+)-transporting) subunit B [Sphingobacteriales bacterium 17-39-43]HQT22484.1 NADH:ubiquinone reductase (Na(+)-transporting) subunit B [Daejeonella sp.]HQT59220.1 NADH:ubiquinone reductase (Na(+)-transporting) subunit B [Daejeonella sp.]
MLLRKLLDKLKPDFEKGGKLEKFYPAFNAFETFLFVPDHTTASKGAHVRDAIDLKRTMVLVILSLIPCLLFGMWNVGYQHHLAFGISDSTIIDNFIFGAIKVLPIVIVSYISGLTVEFIFAIIRKHTINEGFLVSGMLIPLVMPVDVPLWMVAVSTVFAVIIGKEVFGGTGMNILNPALTARAFLFFAYPTKISGNEVWINTSPEDGKQVVDAYSGATPLGDAAAGLADKIPGIWESFIGIIPGSIGETSALACLIGAAILLYTGIGSWRIMLSVFVGGYIMALIFNLFGLNTLMQISPLHHLVLGGFAFGAIFMATDPVSGAQTNTGKYIYGFLIGLFAILFRVFNPAYPEGMMLSILFMNVMAPLIDHYVVAGNIKRRLKRSNFKQHA